MLKINIECQIVMYVSMICNFIPSTIILLKFLLCDVRALCS
jgi:hypothetical protein